MRQRCILMYPFCPFCGITAVPIAAHKTKDIIHVKENVLRHKSIENTMIYIQLEKATFGASKNDEYHVKVAKTIEEACDLVKTGFDFVTGEYSEGGKIFRKRK